MVEVTKKMTAGNLVLENDTEDVKQDYSNDDEHLSLVAMWIASSALEQMMLSKLSLAMIVPTVSCLKIDAKMHTGCQNPCRSEKSCMGFQKANKESFMSFPCFITLLQLNLNEQVPMQWNSIYFLDVKQKNVLVFLSQVIVAIIHFGWTKSS